MTDATPPAAPVPRPSRRKRLARLRQRLRTLPIRGDLAALARVHATDKGYETGAAHGYVAHYQRELGPIRRRVRTVIEIGIGEYADPYRGGASLRLWKDFFPRAVVAGIDLHDKSRQAERRIRIFQGDQTDVAFLRRVVDEVGPPDLVVDDGSHVSAARDRDLPRALPRGSARSGPLRGRRPPDRVLAGVRGRASRNLRRRHVDAPLPGADRRPPGRRLEARARAPRTRWRRTSRG